MLKQDRVAFFNADALTETSYMADRGIGGIGNADMAIKIILKKTMSTSYLKKLFINFSKIKKQKNKIKNEKTHKFNSCCRT